MSGMLMKEFLCFRKQAKAMLVCLAVLLAVTAVLRQPQGDNPVKALSAAVGAATALAVVFTVNIMAYEEKAKWDLFVKSLPLSSRAIVGARYLLMLCFTAAGAGFVLAAAVLFRSGKMDPEIWACIWVGGWAVPLILCSVLLPLLYKFSIQKTITIFFLLVFIVPTLTVGLLWKSGFSPSPAGVLVLLKLSPLLVFAVVVLSFLTSCKIYSRKEI